MKVQGIAITAPSVCTIVIPREAANLIFKVGPVLNFDDFDAICPKPEMNWIQRPGQPRSKNPEDPNYKKAVGEWADKRSAWMFLKSLDFTDSLEWETVKWDDPTTWASYQDELQSSGLMQGEIATLMTAILDVCGMNQQKIDEATKSFLAGQDEQNKSASSQNTEPSATQSGDPVSD